VTAAALAPKTAFVYPPLTAWLAAPFTALPLGVGEGLATALAIGCILGALWLVGVRDWRCYAAVSLWEPVYSAVQTANVNVLLALGFALLWRYRRQPVVAGIVTGAMIGLKPFVWPVALWLLCTRRFRATIWAAGSAAFFVLAPWAAFGFAGIRSYPHLMSLLSEVEGKDAYTVEALLHGVVSWRFAEAAAALVGLGVLAVMTQLVRKDERGSFALAIAACLVLSPIVWMDYFVLLAVALGLLSRRFSGVWLLPLAFWIAPQVGNGAAWQTVAALAIAAATVVVALRGRPSLPTADLAAPAAAA